jgi:hypothetical protein
MDKEDMKPILFNTLMVQAILAGQKTMTRRVVKAKPPYTQKQLHERVNYRSEEDVADDAKNGRYSSVGFWTPWDGYVYHRDCPYNVGDILYVREAWCPVATIESWLSDKNLHAYRADYVGKVPWKWHPSIHMPKEAARIFLRVTGVRVARLQDITEEDSRNEGVKDPYDYQKPEYYEQPQMRGLEINKSAFAGLWDRINHESIYSWDANPWVWVIEFERCEKPNY